MTQESIIRLLTDQETMLEKRRTTALARGMWTKVIEVEAVLAYSKAIRDKIATMAEQPVVSYAPRLCPKGHERIRVGNTWHCKTCNDTVEAV